MGKKIRGHIRSNVVGYVALFFALSGGAAWATHPGGANTISSLDIINGEVRSADIGSGNVQNSDLGGSAVTGGKIAPGTVQGSDVQNDDLTGTDIDEASLTGLNATPANEVHSSGRVAVVNADAGETPTSNLIDTGTFQVHGLCTDTGAIHAKLKINSSDDYAVASDGGLNLASTSGENNLLTFVGSAGIAEQTVGTFEAVASTGEALHGSYHAVTTAQGADCVFAVSAIGQ